MSETSIFNTENISKTRHEWFREYSSQRRDKLVDLCNLSNIELQGYVKKSVLIDLLMERHKRGYRKKKVGEATNEATNNTVAPARRKTSLKRRVASRLTYPKQFSGSLDMKQGPRDYMEDTYVVAKYDDMTLYGVFDGHGGDEVSRLLPKLVSEGLLKGLPPHIRYQTGGVKNHISKTMYEIDHNLSKRQDAKEAGSTATMLLHIPPMAYLINIGDSRTLLAKKRQNGGYSLCKATVDHKPDQTQEYNRIVQTGGKVTHEIDDDARVDGVLAMSRAIGDHELKYHTTQQQLPQYGPVSSHPDIYSVNLEKDGKYIAILASDGLWDVVDNDKALKYSHHFGPESAATPLTQYALKNHSMDNITTLVAML